MKQVSFKDLTPKQKELILHAEKAMKRAFNPLTGFVVGAAVRTSKGKIYEGANMNISSTGLCVCAEVHAFLAANLDGQRTFAAIAVIGSNGTKKVKEPSVPCGRCCQIIHEFNQLAKTDMEMLYANTSKSKVLVGTVKDFLPHPFISGIFRK